MSAEGLTAIAWRDNAVELIDQTQLPAKLLYRRYATVRGLRRAICTLQVRGAPAIGVAGAFGMVLAMRAARYRSRAAALRRLEQARQLLISARPTAVNLAWAVESVCAAGRAARQPADMPVLMLARAQAIAAAERQNSARMAEHGLSLITPGSTLLTYCNTGMLATVGDGTALAVIYAAHRRDRSITVYACETRPLLQGARLTAWELQRAKVPVRLICDNMAGYVLRQRRIDAVLIGADRICANGDAANKIGSYALAVLAAAHQVPLYVVAPCSTIDMMLPDGDRIEIEERPAGEVRRIGRRPVAPADVSVYNPAFDVVPARLITALVTERGIVRPPWRRGIAAMMAR